MKRPQGFLRSFGIFSAGSLITFATLNYDKIKEQKISAVIPKGSSESANESLSLKSTSSSSSHISAENVTKYKNLGAVIENCRSKIEQWKAKECIPGVVIGVTINGQPVWKYSTGYSDIENNVKCNENTVMRIASISKSITSTYLMKMVESNKLDLDKPISEYLTEDKFPHKVWDDKPVDITLRQLAAHLGGIRHYKTVKKNGYTEYPEFLLNKNYSSAIESLKIFKDDPLIAKPGTKFHYTTFGWTLISAVMESRLEKSNFGEAFQKFIRTELGLRNTQLDKNPVLIPYRSKYYYLNKDKLRNCPEVDNSSKWAGGGLVSNIGDLLQFGNLMLYSAVPGRLPGFFTCKQIDDMWSPLPATVENGHIAGYGIGWVSVKNGTAKVAFGPEAAFDNFACHTGAAVGASSVLLVEPKSEIVVAILTNLQGANGILDTAIELTKQFSNA